MIEAKGREIMIGKSRMYLGEDNILYITVVGEVDEKLAIAMKEADLKFKRMVKGKFNVLADLNNTRKPSAKARKIWREMAEQIESGKIAMFGLHPVARVIANFFMGSSKKKDLRFFKTREEALAWLRKGRFF